ncbi:MAG: hypothetical protein M3Y49_04850 [Actinomycetota bacterium]|nr:hypothetical protein [Actinomycetota bacterium]
MTAYRADSAMADYRQSLILALRMRDLDGDRIGEIVAQVESHVADTGEDPGEAFGPAREYADLITADRPRNPRWPMIIIALFGAVAGWLVAQGALAQLLGETSFGRPGWVSLIIGLLVGAPTALVVRRRSTRVRDPRTGADMVPASGWELTTLIGLPVAVILIAWGAIELAT